MFNGGINSAQYTFLSQDGYDNSPELKKDILQNTAFLMLGQEENITTPNDKESESGNSNKLDSSILEKYMNMRKNDDDTMKKLFVR